ncbi:MAG: DNA repair protein RecO [Oligoflexia bacterium]|nr:DNA repair protein RecO [Oligoflexia bacterium]
MTPEVYRGIILTRNAFGEGHVNIQLLTREAGLIRAAAFGGKRFSKRFRGNLDFFNILDLEIDNKNEKYYSIAGIRDAVRKFLKIPCSMERYISACYVLEQSSLILTPGDPAGKTGKTYFETVTGYLEKIEAAGDKAILFGLAYAFQVELLQETGFLHNYISGRDARSMFRQMEELNLEFASVIPKSFSLLESLI